jgi:hypothetical protein
MPVNAYLKIKISRYNHSTGVHVPVEQENGKNQIHNSKNKITKTTLMKIYIITSELTLSLLPSTDVAVFNTSVRAAVLGTHSSFSSLPMTTVRASIRTCGSIPCSLLILSAVSGNGPKKKKNK